METIQTAVRSKSKIPSEKRNPNNLFLEGLPQKNLITSIKIILISMESKTIHNQLKLTNNVAKTIKMKWMRLTCTKRESRSKQRTTRWGKPKPTT